MSGEINQVVNLEDYRPKLEGKPCIISFIGFSFQTPEGEPMKLNFVVDLENGDYQAAIDAVRENGGVYLESPGKPDVTWFLPWPCAAVRIVPRK